jgi:hypothetical protein
MACILVAHPRARDGFHAEVVPEPILLLVLTDTLVGGLLQKLTLFLSKRSSERAIVHLPWCVRYSSRL